MEQINLIIADDHDFFRDGLVGQIRQSPRFNIIDACRDGEHLLRAIAKQMPDVALIDLRMPVIAGIDAIKEISSKYSQVRIIVLTNYDAEFMIEEALEAGALSYVTKGMPKDKLFEAIETTYRNEPYYCHSTINKLRRSIIANRTAVGSASNPVFTAQELVVIRWICMDKRVADIADLMNLGKRTVEKYRASILEKMYVKTTAGIAIYAIRNGLFFPEEE